MVTEYSYDAASRLIGQTFKNGTNTLGTLNYGYDGSGSRVSTEGTWARTGLPSTVASATYNAANQQTAFAGATQTFDLNGNLTSDGTNTYTWDARNQLASMSGGSVTASFAYDALGRRRSKTINSTQTRFHYDGLTPVQEQDGSGTVTANLLPGSDIDEYLARTAGGSTSSHLTDILGSTVAELDGSVATQAEYTYEPFGQTATTGASGNPLRYTGREDDSTGLYFYRARYYSAGLQRFLSEDPLDSRGGDVNLYAYVGNRPTVLRDPLGLFWDGLFADLDCGYPPTLASRKGRPAFQLPSERPTIPHNPGRALALATGVDCSKITSQCVVKCLHLLPSPTRDRQSSEFHKCVADCKREHGC